MLDTSVIVAALRSRTGASNRLFEFVALEGADAIADDDRAPVLDASAVQFDHDPLPAFQVKGKRDQIQASVLGRPRQAAGAAAIPLVGRDAERDWLGTLLHRAEGGSGSAVEIVGDPGVGKSRLVSEIAATARIPTLLLRCDEYEQIGRASCRERV